MILIAASCAKPLTLAKVKAASYLVVVEDVVQVGRGVRVVVVDEQLADLLPVDSDSMVLCTQAMASGSRWNGWADRSTMVGLLDALAGSAGVGGAPRA